MAEIISAKLPTWLASPQPEIRSAAIILSSDYSTKVMAKQRLALMNLVFLSTK
jgi:hypothetical protein